MKVLIGEELKSSISAASASALAVNNAAEHLLLLQTPTAIITQERLQELESCAEQLSCLEACGVDNWQGYSDAMQMYNEAMEEEGNV